MESKKLGEWTLAELKKHCAKTYCVRCRYSGDNGKCILTNATPCRWPIDEGAQNKPTTGTKASVGPAKPRLAEMLGVEEDEIWRCEDSDLMYRVHDEIAEFRLGKDDQWEMCLHTPFIFDIISHPEKVVHIPPHLTEAELAICKVMGAEWVSVDDGDDLHAKLWCIRPTKTDGEYTNGAIPVAEVMRARFPSVRAGACVHAEEAENNA